MGLVGRSAELGELATLLDRAAAGFGAAITLVGTAGSGKSSLAAAAAALARERGFEVAGGSPVRGRPGREKLTLGGDGGGVFDLDNRDGVTLTATRVTAAGPPVAEIADALAGRPAAAAVLGGLPASSRAALSRMADFFNTPAGRGPA
jgi:hypothetical protein